MEREQRVAEAGAVQLTYKVHQTIKKVTEDVERFHLNTAISSIMELVNATYKYLETPRSEEAARRLTKGVIEITLVLLFPFVPHITEELWSMIDTQGRVLGSWWPRYDENYIKEDKVTIVVQVNGKLRDQCAVDRGLEESQLKEIVFGLEKIQRHLEGKEVRKTIIVPNKLVNIVVSI